MVKQNYFLKNILIRKYLTLQSLKNYMHILVVSCLIQEAREYFGQNTYANIYKNNPTIHIQKLTFKYIFLKVWPGIGITLLNWMNVNHTWSKHTVEAWMQISCGCSTVWIKLINRLCHSTIIKSLHSNQTSPKPCNFHD